MRELFDESIEAPRAVEGAVHENEMGHGFEILGSGSQREALRERAEQARGGKAQEEVTRDVPAIVDRAGQEAPRPPRDIDGGSRTEEVAK